MKNNIKKTNSVSSGDLSIIIVNYNGLFWLKKTLESLKTFYLEQTERTVDVIVVDNCSTDNSVSILKKSFPWVKLHVLESNLGFAAGNNYALKKVTTPYVMLLNSDVELNQKSNIDALITVLDEQPSIGIITPKLLLTNGELDWACHRGEPTLWASATYFLGLENMFPKIKLFSSYHQTYKDTDTIHEIDACSGAAMVLRIKDINKVGYLDEQFFMYAEDLDWAKRFREAGFSVLYYPLVEIVHHKNKSGIASEKKKLAQQSSNFFYDTMLQYYDKHYRDIYPRWVRSLVQTIVTIKKGAS